MGLSSVNLSDFSRLAEIIFGGKSNSGEITDKDYTEYNRSRAEKYEKQNRLYLRANRMLIFMMIVSIVMFFILI